MCTHQVYTLPHMHTPHKQRNVLFIRGFYRVCLKKEQLPTTKQLKKTKHIFHCVSKSRQGLHQRTHSFHWDANSQESKERLGAGETAQRLKALTTQPEVNLQHPHGGGWKGQTHASYSLTSKHTRWKVSPPNRCNFLKKESKEQ